MTKQVLSLAKAFDTQGFSISIEQAPAPCVKIAHYGQTLLTLRDDALINFWESVDLATHNGHSRERAIKFVAAITVRESLQYPLPLTDPTTKPLKVSE